MMHSVGLVAALVNDHLARSRVLGALGNRPIRWCSFTRELIALAADDSVWAAVVEPWDSAGEATHPGVAALHAASPTACIVAYCRLSRDDVRELVMLARCGASIAIIRDIDDLSTTLKKVLVEKPALYPSSEFMKELSPRATPQSRAIVESAVLEPGKLRSVQELAREVGVTRKTVENRLKRDGLPAPGTLLTWSRLFQVALSLSDINVSIAHAASKCGFGSVTALRRALRRHANLRPSELRSANAANDLILRFRASLTNKVHSDKKPAVVYDR